MKNIFTFISMISKVIEMVLKDYENFHFVEL